MSSFQPFDILIQSTKLLFEEVQIPENLRPAVQGINTLEPISFDGLHCIKFLLLVAFLKNGVNRIGKKVYF